MRITPVKILGAVVLLAVIGLVSLPLVTTVMWVGHFPLNVALTSTSGSPIARLQYLTDRSASKEQLLRDEGEYRNRFFRPVEKFDGQSFTVDVNCSGHNSDSFFGGERTYYQEKWIAVLVEYTNGKTARVVADIPEGRGPRAMSIVVP